jgi:hypothetical protein
LLRFNQLFEMLNAGTVHQGWLSTVENKDNIFPKLDYRVYRSDYEPWLAAGSERAPGSERGI